jgi:hypothetical protein
MQEVAQVQIPVNKTVAVHVRKAHGTVTGDLVRAVEMDL